MAAVSTTPGLPLHKGDFRVLRKTPARLTLSAITLLLLGRAVPADTPHLDPALSAPGGAAALTVLPAAKQDCVVFQEAGRYGGWPANGGAWSWGNEIVVGFTAAWYKAAKNDHAVDRSQPFEKWQARSLDGGQTWSIEKPGFPDDRHTPQCAALKQPLNFTNPDFALVFHFLNMQVGPSYFYASADRCRTWQGPYSFQVDGVDNISTRTDYIVLGPRECLMLGSAAKADRREGRPFCACTTDGGLHWKLVSFIGPEPAGFAIMPSTLRLSGTSFLTAIRNGEPGQRYDIDAWRSDDAGRKWTCLGRATGDIGGNPPALVRLNDGRICLTYGYRKKPYGVRARITADEGRTWGPEIVLRNDGLSGDLGYPRSVVRPDGRIVTIYYFNGPVRDEQRTIQATIWAPPGGRQPAPQSGVSRPGGLAVVNRVRFFPAPQREQAMLGGRFTGSNLSASAGFQLLAEIKTAPPRDAWTEIALANTTPYRWVRYEAPPGSHGNVAEVEFYAGPRKLGGAGFGTAGFVAPGIHWKGALDGKTSTWFNSDFADGQYVGLDLLDQAATAHPSFTPAPGDYDGPQQVTIRCPTPRAVIRYALDGVAPDSPTAGLPYTQPIALAGRTTLVAVAFREGLAPSPASYGTYWIGQPTRPALNSFHVGNSLTGNTRNLPLYARTAGYRHNYQSFLMGGALTAQLWRATETGEKKRWEETLGKLTLPLQHFTVQPRDYDVAREACHAVKFFDLVAQRSPDVQPWLYAEWIEIGRQRPSDRAEVPSYQMQKLWPALTWEESMSAMLLYVEEVRHTIAQTHHTGKAVRVLPVALAMGWARNLIDQGQLPGVPPGQASFYATLFEDHVHVNANGAYLADATWYAAFYRESPEGKVLPVGTSLTAQQAAVLQRLAWNVVQNYPDCGLYEEGATPAGRPRFSPGARTLRDVTPVTLQSDTPGAWFRYTLDGTTPTRTNGYVFCGVVSVRPGMTLKAVAYKSGLADSPVAEVSYPAGR